LYAFLLYFLAISAMRLLAISNRGWHNSLALSYETFPNFIAKTIALACPIASFAVMSKYYTIINILSSAFVHKTGQEQEKHAK